MQSQEQKVRSVCCYLGERQIIIVPVPTQRPIPDNNKHLHPISLTPILSKIAEYYVVQDFVIPAVLKKINT